MIPLHLRMQTFLQLLLYGFRESSLSSSCQAYEKRLHVISSLLATPRRILNLFVDKRPIPEPPAMLGDGYILSLIHSSSFETSLLQVIPSLMAAGYNPIKEQQIHHGKEKRNLR
ncbi:CCR4-NOT transcription complex subunit 7 [Phyllostomus discolor]|uniref:CCR4-NOT transcription complex subunit 7 n=1 Tax=Phyllostomus discolor TaxID=89673 RepID=A0A833YVZ4_9CHIR|nr:CCR4-NOT transcription complex subunit 7 [Phyllostomus discolor]